MPNLDQLQHATTQREQSNLETLLQEKAALEAKHPDIKQYFELCKSIETDPRFKTTKAIDKNLSLFKQLTRQRDIYQRDHSKKIAQYNKLNTQIEALSSSSNPSYSKLSRHTNRP